MARSLLVWAFASIFFLFGIVGATGAELIVSKAKRSLEYQDDGALRQFPIGLGSSPVGAKTRQGDRRTPEGVYFITHKNSKSQFYLSLGISYPNLDDARAGLHAG